MYISMHMYVYKYESIYMYVYVYRYIYVQLLKDISSVFLFFIYYSCAVPHVFCMKYVFLEHL